jgi:DNA-directed RNA polymerase specialized sigma24 family protein
MSQKDYSKIYYFEALMKGDLAETKRALDELLGRDSDPLNRSIRKFAEEYQVRLDLHPFEDIYMDAVARVLNSLDRVKKAKSNVAGYLWRIGQNTVADLQRKSIKIERSEASWDAIMLEEKDSEHLIYDPTSPHLSYPDRMIEKLIEDEEGMQIAIQMILLCLSGEQRLAALLGLLYADKTLATEDIVRLTGWTPKKFRDQRWRARRKVKAWMELVKEGYTIPLAKDTHRDVITRGELCSVIHVDFRLTPHLKDEALRPIGLRAQDLGPRRGSNTEYVSGLVMDIDPFNPKIYYQEDPGDWLFLEVRRREDHEHLRIAQTFRKDFKCSSIIYKLEFSEGEIWVSESCEFLQKVGEIDGLGWQLLAVFEDLDLTIWE